jgi:hypothetical protein
MKRGSALLLSDYLFQTKKVFGRFGLTFFTLKPRGVLMDIAGAGGRKPLLCGRRDRPE